MFDFSDYHILLAVFGACIILSYWLPRFVSSREPAASVLLILSGLLGYSLFPVIPAFLNPLNSPQIWEVVSELTLIVALFATGLSIDQISAAGSWKPTQRLLLVTMPLTIAIIALLGWFVAGMTVAGAILLGAVLAPTDPVLAGDMQVGPPQEGNEHPVRFTLTTESGLNDALAFPFVYLGLIVAAEGLTPSQWVLEWIVRDIFYRIAAGALSGAAIGWILGKILFATPRENPLSKTGAGIIALAGVLFCYGATELIEGYGFIAVFVAGLAIRHVETKHAFHKRLHVFSETIEHALSAAVLIMLGGTLPILWPYLDWKHALVALALIFIIRPAAGWISLRNANLNAQERAVVAIYGVRGVGSIYYLGYAGSHIEFVNEAELWAMIAFTILVSTTIHGLTAGFTIERVTQIR